MTACSARGSNFVPLHHSPGRQHSYFTIDEAFDNTSFLDGAVVAASNIGEINFFFFLTKRLLVPPHILYGSAYPDVLHRFCRLGHILLRELQYFLGFAAILQPFRGLFKTGQGAASLNFNSLPGVSAPNRQFPRSGASVLPFGAGSPEGPHRSGPPGLSPGASPWGDPLQASS